jgi:DNA-binding HxlR family transcriptional regulator
MARTHKKVSASPRRQRGANLAAAQEFGEAEEALKIIEGRWKLRILVHLRISTLIRFSDLKRAIPAVTEKMLIQQLRELERDGAVRRTAHAEVPPRVEYSLTDWGLKLCPALDELRRWSALKPARHR